MKKILENHGYQMRLTMFQSIMALCVIALLSISLVPAVSYAESDAPATTTEAAQSADTDTQQQDSEAAASTATEEQDEENVAVPALIGVGSILLLVYIVTHKFRGKKGKFSDEE